MSEASTTTFMRRETDEAAEVVARLLEREGQAIADLGARLRMMPPAAIVTSARGSSDHAASYLKYAVEISLGLPVASIGPSVASVYGAQLRLPGGVVFSVSQSGQSPDILALQANARRGGALAVALLNRTDSPLAEGADIVIPLHAGEEKSVAATKSFVASVAAAAAITAVWTGDEVLERAVRDLPAAISRSARMDWTPALERLVTARSLFTVGRGPAFAIALEAALKCKETAGLHAEAFSAAEVAHGPMQIVGPDVPILAFVPADAAEASSLAALERLRAFGGAVFAVGEGRDLPSAATGHGLTDSIPMIVAFYVMAEALARRRGLDPDRPAKLRKVTETV
ncbi:SIS domain-containing protein [Aureimonas sp. D3]|uniref:SIS domain-containing protein n=1 Tax=Aureimonas sp. D3 TaxID=1638164 RepID=UPI000783C9B1|nr:SIS domain-containing protein [Aureimonas sp. D3]